MPGGNLELEAGAFDHQINERVKNGHFPDLRRSGRCEYFYNNVWRDQYFANLYFGELVQKVIQSASKYFPGKDLRDLTLLEVGCGPGHVCLELARNRLNVVGLDISQACLGIARKVANEDPYSEGRGTINYVCSDFLEFQGTFDIILFTASLHHFPNTDEIISHSFNLLKKGGILIADEPIRDQVSRKNAAVILLLKGLLSATGSYHDKVSVPLDEKGLGNLLQEIYTHERYETEEGEKLQSVNDNEAGLNDMYGALNKYYQQLEFVKDFAIYHQTIGGLRLNSIEEEHKSALFIKQMDSLLCSLGVLDPTNFYFVGRKE